MDDELFRYIKPGDFSFCGRCGEICRRGDQYFMCTSCKASLFGLMDNPSSEEWARYKQEVRAERLASDRNRAERQHLAISRRDSPRGYEGYSHANCSWTKVRPCKVCGKNQRSVTDVKPISEKCLTCKYYPDGPCFQPVPFGLVKPCCYRARCPKTEGISVS